MPALFEYQMALAAVEPFRGLRDDGSSYWSVHYFDKMGRWTASATGMSKKDAKRAAPWVVEEIRLLEDSLSEARMEIDRLSEVIRKYSARLATTNERESEIRQGLIANEKRAIEAERDRDDLRRVVESDEIAKEVAERLVADALSGKIHQQHKAALSLLVKAERERDEAREMERERQK